MNWKTTTTGILGALSALISIATALINGQSFDPALIPAIIASIGLILAKDAK